MQNQEFDIARLFAGFLSGRLTGEEQKTLEKWKAASAENQALFEKVCGGENFRELNRMAAHYDPEKAWRKVEKNFQPGRRVALRRWMVWAAVLVLPLCFSYFFLRHLTPEDKSVTETTVAGQAGTSKAILTMADGSTVELRGNAGLQLKEKDGTQIHQDSAMLAYHAIPGQEGESMYNKMEIPRGGEYALLLSDGTLVYLNAMTTLSFPVHFAGDTREVELEGEAYFEVKKDTRPFVVRTKEVRIQVLGTQFNVSAYPEDAAVKTTLVQGSVKVEARRTDKRVILQPSRQAVFCKTSGKLEMKEVKVDEYIAWKNGKFDFRDWRLEDMMNYLARWYDVEVSYQNEALKEMRFGCYINRYSEIRPILEFLEKTGKIRVSLNGKNILFSPK